MRQCKKLLKSNADRCQDIKPNTTSWDESLDESFKWKTRLDDATKPSEAKVTKNLRLPNSIPRTPRGLEYDYFHYLPQCFSTYLRSTLLAIYLAIYLGV